MELFVTIIKGWNLLVTVTKSFTLDVEEILDPVWAIW